MITAPALRAHAAGVLFAILVAVQTAGAQSTPDVAHVAVARPSSYSPPGPASDSAKGPETTAPAVVATGAPRSYQVVSIPVPDALLHVANVGIEIVPRGEFVVLGPRTRFLGAVSTGKARIAVTLGIPAGALAGRLIAAEARFSSPAGETVIVPVEIDVSLVREILLRPTTTPINGQAGSDVFLPFAIVNSGNAREKVDVRLTLPDGWAARDLHKGPVTLEPGETIKRRVRLSIPALSSTGSSFVGVELFVQGASLGSATMTVEIFNSSSIGRQSGPLLVSAISHAPDETGRPNSLFTLSATGALFDSVRIDARASHGTGLGAAASNAFARLGSYQSSASVVLSAPSGQLSLGNTGASFSDLTGLYPYGQGVLLDLHRSDWSLMGLGAASMAAPISGKREPMLGFRAARQFGEMQISSSISHLADVGSSPRRLDAVGLGVAIPSPFRSTFKTEIAERRFAGGTGFGWSSELVRIDPDRNEQIRVTHAPGGSDAFARATNEILVNVSEQLTSRGSVGASAWRTTDATSVFSSLKSNGFSLRPQYAVRPSTTVAIDARSYLFDASSRLVSTTGAEGFGSKENQIGISVSSSIRQYFLNSSAYLGNVSRTITPLGQQVITERTPRNYWMTNAGWSNGGGIVEVQARVEQTRDRVGFVNQQTIVGVRGEQVVVPWFGGIRAEGELQRVEGFGSEKSAIVRAGVAIPLVNGFALKLDVERNSIFRSNSGHVPWIVGARFEHVITLPMLRMPGTSGYVYEDLNGNGRRDDAEPGVASAIVRRGSESAVADKNGKYRLGGDLRQAIMVDEASLPEGWSAIGASKNDLGVTLSASAIVELIVAARSGISEVKVDLSKAHIIARDTAGREWAAKMTGPTTATFEALPIGTYSVEFDLSDVSEPLVARSPVSKLVVSGKESKSISVTLDPRPIRMWNGGGSQRNKAPASDQRPNQAPSGTRP